MKKFFIKLILGITLVSVILGFVITLIRYAAEKPVAKVEIIKICQREGGNAYSGGYFLGEKFANVKILEIYDTVEFKKEAHKISRDGQRANLDFSKGYDQVGKTYLVYKEDSLRERYTESGICDRWQHFGYHWRLMSVDLFFGIFFGGLMILALVMTIYEKREERE